MIDSSRVITEFFRFVKIDSPTFSERAMAEALKQSLESLGLEVQTDQLGEQIGGNCGNIFAFLPANVPHAPTLLFSAHLDCVGPCRGVKPHLADGMIQSSGDTVLGSDDKAGIVGILEALRVVKDMEIPHGGIQLIFTVAEEKGLLGSKYLNEAGIQADYGYVLDAGGSPGQIIVQAPGQNIIQVKVHGKAAHAGMAPEEGVNAIVVAAKAIASIPDGRIDDETTANIGIIQGGTASNIVPDTVVITAETRSLDSEKLQKLTKRISDTFSQTAKNAGVKVEMEVSPAYPSFKLFPEAPVVALAVKAAQKIGLNALLCSTGSGSDANNFNAYGLPCAVLAIGMQKIHTCEERILVKDLLSVAEFVIEIIRTAAVKREN